MQTNGRCKVEYIVVGDLRFPVVPPTEGFRILGAQFTLAGGISKELDARVAAAWGKFRQIWPLLRRKDTSVTKRLRLFDSSVGSCFLWCCESWTLSKQQMSKIRSAQRSMLRRFAGPRRRPDETYIEWVQRATREAEAVATQAGVRMWVPAVLSSKWCWAGHVERMGPHRWAKRMTHWRDDRWWKEQDHRSSALRPKRARAGRHTRCEHDLCKFAAELGWVSWNKAACERPKDVWNKLRHQSVDTKHETR